MACTWGSPSLKSEVLVHHTPGREYLCLGKSQEECLLFPDENLGQAQFPGTPWYVLSVALWVAEVRGQPLQLEATTAEKVCSSEASHSRTAESQLPSGPSPVLSLSWKKRRGKGSK